MSKNWYILKKCIFAELALSVFIKNPALTDNSLKEDPPTIFYIGKPSQEKTPIIFNPI